MSEKPGIVRNIEDLHARVTTNADHVATELGLMTKQIHGLGEVARQEWESTNDRIDSMEVPPVIESKSAIYTALAAAQVEITNADKNVDNEFTKKKYADLASVLDAVRPHLASNGIALFQITEDPGQGLLGIRTVLAHGESGQTIQDVITMAPPKNDPQGIGSCRTYMRRYAILALCGIAGAADDDAEGTKDDPNEYERITVAQQEKILMEADELFDERADAVIAKMLNRLFGGITKVADIRAGEHEAALNNLKNAKKLMVKNEAAAKKKEQDEAAEAAEK